ncbi:MAG: hypothetical protein CBB87_10450 [Micavibrio sp. TMED27]|nr:MAG: hypothetical protein CBB87_10450 [Micavibrio sp. TMED27]|tara:strand:+ start:539 stop:829 length:291 start_codon:yes stop_codon:yes gene_type:complete
MIMSEKENDSVGRKPDYIAYSVRDTHDGKGNWNKVGAAWGHRDGQGIDLQLDATPVDGRVTLRELRDERMNSYEDERQAEISERSSERKEGRGRAR